MSATVPTGPWPFPEADAACALNQALRREWLETNGLGGYACSTAAGANIRREHGLLVAALDPPGRRFVLISKLEEAVGTPAGIVELGSNVYSGAVHPDGFRRLRHLAVDPFPEFRYAGDGFRLRKTVASPWGEHATLVRWDVDAAEGPLELVFRPLVAARPDDALVTENPDLDPAFVRDDNRLVFRPYAGVPPFQLAWVGGAEPRVEPTGYWYRSFAYGADAPPGREDLFNPCRIVIRADAGETIWLLASLRIAPVCLETVTALYDLERYRRRGLGFAGRGARREGFERWLARAADQFLVRVPGGPIDALPDARILAGYPGGGERARETLIALPGLLLATGRRAEARSLLDRLAERWRDAAAEGPDVPLWFVHAVDRYLRDTGEIESVARRPWRAVREILDAYCGAGVAGVRADDRSLLVREGPATACRVDLQALWFNALSVGSFLAQTLDGGRAARELNRRARACRRSFLAAFWDAREERLADAVGAASRDTTLRARQLLAVGLPNSMLGRPEQQCVVRRIEAEILDPCGLRSAAAIEPGWLGAFAAAYRQAFGRGPATAARLAEIIGGLEHEIARQGLGSLPERFTLDAREPAGMIASALSVAGVACAYREAISSGRP